VKYCFESLVGRWRDTKAKASTYEVSVHDSKVTIRTTRHDGLVLVTTGLVRRDVNSGCIIWGQPGPRQYWLSELDSRSLKWRHQRLAAFVWHRVGECPVPPKSEEDRPTQTSPSPSKLRQELKAQHDKECENDLDTAGRSKSSLQAEAGAEGPEAKSRGASSSTVAQGKQSHSQKGACGQEDDRGASGSAETQGKQGRSQSAGKEIILVTAEEVKKRKLKLAPLPPEEVKKARKLAPPPLRRSDVRQEEDRGASGCAGSQGKRGASGCDGSQGKRGRSHGKPSKAAPKVPGLQNLGRCHETASPSAAADEVKKAEARMPQRVRRSQPELCDTHVETVEPTLSARLRALLALV